MTRRSDTRGLHGAGAPALERVLQAERDAQTQIEQVRQQARAQLDAARDDALAIVNRSMERIARWQRGHASALARRLQAERDRAESSNRARPLPDSAALARAVEQVAQVITGADDRSA